MSILGAEYTTKRTIFRANVVLNLMLLKFATKRTIFRVIIEVSEFAIKCTIFRVNVVLTPAVLTFATKRTIFRVNIVLTPSRNPYCSYTSYRVGVVQDRGN